MIPSLSLHKYSETDPTFSIEKTVFLGGDRPSGRGSHIVRGAEALKQVYSSRTSAVIVARSLPYPSSLDTAFALAAACDVNPPTLISVGDNCASVNDAMLIAIDIATRTDTTAAAIVADEFRSVVDQKTLLMKPDTDSWRNAASGIRFSKKGRVRLVATCRATYPRLARLCYLDDGLLRVDHNLADEFNNLDLKTELRVIGSLLSSYKFSTGNTLRLAVTNRSTARSANLVQKLRGSPIIFSTRKTVGHTGGSDMIINLSNAIDSLGDAGGDIVCSANGLGYSWSAIHFSIMPK